MSYKKLDCDRLNKDEISYELRVRGFVDVGNVQEMRSCLRKLLKMEQTGETLTYPQYNLKFEEERKIIGDKITEINQLIKDLNTLRNSGPCKNIETKIAHLLKRIDRMIAKDDDGQKEKSMLFTAVFQSSSDLEERLKALENANGSVLDASIAPPNSSDSEDEGASGVDVINRNLSVLSTTRPSTAKSVPVMKWNISFSGEIKDMSVSAFLERIEELSIARHVSKEELFNSAIDLFKGKALIWYRANRRSFNDWETLAKEMKMQFQPHDYDEKLYDEIKERTQGSDEPIGIYLSAMSNLFNRLSIKIPEATKLKILLKNISPFFQLNLGLVEINSIDELKTMCMKLEARKSCIDNFKSPPRRKNDLLEPDLAYISNIPELSTPQTQPSNEIAAVKCWNCDKLGHRSANCEMPKRKHCYRCGAPNVTVRTCIKCSRVTENSAGNEQQSH